MQTPDNELTAELVSRLRDLAAGPEPPAWLEQRTADALHSRGMLREPRRASAQPRRTIVWLVAAVTACAVLLAAGFVTGERRTRAPAAPTGNRYALFVTTQGESASAPPAQEADRVREYSKWAREQVAAGHLIAGEKLSETSLALTGSDPRARRDSSLAILGGYFIIVANNLDEATVIARTCPHLRHGGTLVIRPIEPTP